MKVLFLFSCMMLVSPLVDASQAQRKVKHEHASQREAVGAQSPAVSAIAASSALLASQAAPALPYAEIEGQSDQVVGQFERKVAAAQPFEQQLAERRLREAERAKKEKEENERGAQQVQENVQGNRYVEREVAGPAHNRDVEEDQIEGVDAREQAFMFQAKGSDYLQLGRRDAFRSDELEPILLVKTFEQLRKEKHDNNQSLILVRVFDGDRPYYYDVNVFHRLINEGGRDVKNPNPPRSLLREITHQIHYFECKISRDESKKRELVFLCSYSQLIENIKVDGLLSRQFIASGYDLFPHVSVLERRNQRLEYLGNYNRQWPVGWRAKCLEGGKWVLLAGFPLAVGFVHGLLNNWLARRAGCDLRRWSCVDSPAREWLTGLGALGLVSSWMNYLQENEDELQFRPQSYKWLLLGAFFGGGLLQELGEGCPLPGCKGQWRTFPRDVKPWELNVSLGIAAGMIPYDWS